jgi:3-oxoacyl-(acyl-carrier-protein) synthase
MKRVVITGMGIVAPNGNELCKFYNSLTLGISGLKTYPCLKDSNLVCNVAGVPELDNESDRKIKEHLNQSVFNAIGSLNIKYALNASIQAINDAALQWSKTETLWDAGCIFGTSTADINELKNIIKKVDEKRIRELGVRNIEQFMTCGISAYIAGVFGLANRVYTNSSACATGTDSILLAYEHIKNGYANVMVAGSTEAPSHYIWANFDNMRILERGFNEFPEKASRPMDVQARGFIPAAGAGTIVLEELNTAVKRGAKIYAEVLGGSSNCGGQRDRGSMTNPNSDAVIRCIFNAVSNANIDSKDIGLICGHLTGTMGDKTEIHNWSKALNRAGEYFPFINTVKSMTGHCLSGAGSIECIAAILQLYNQTIHLNKNCEIIQTEIIDIISGKKIPTTTFLHEFDTVIKANFGFGDANACLIFKKYKL